jgi:non-heme Fe2+,alpha-ketoglutarate-dependent halogenase
MSSVKTFQAVPDADELARLGRDLRFHPSKTEKPKVMTREQVEAFNRDGFVRPFRVYSPEEIADIRAYFDRLLAQYVAEGKDSYSISSAHLRHGRVYDILTNPRIVALVKDLLGEDVVGWGTHFFCKMPRDGKAVAWHQDASYWPLSPSKAVTVWLAIDDADPENANMRFIAGSHHVGHLTFRPSDPSEHNVLNQTIENAEQYGPVVDDSLKAGECSLHSDLLLHGSKANMSDRRRCGLTIRYAAADVRAGMDWNLKGVVVSGKDSSGHWANPKRPAED